MAFEEMPNLVTITNRSLISPDERMKAAEATVLVVLQEMVRITQERSGQSMDHARAHTYVRQTVRDILGE